MKWIGLFQESLTRFQKIFSLRVPMNPCQCRKAKLERTIFSMVQYCKITVGDSFNTSISGIAGRFYGHDDTVAQRRGLLARFGWQESLIFLVSDARCQRKQGGISYKYRHWYDRHMTLISLISALHPVQYWQRGNKEKVNYIKRWYDTYDLSFSLFCPTVASK